MLKFRKKHASYRNVHDIGNQEKSHFSNTGKNLAKAGVFRWVTTSKNIKDITIPLIIHYYLLRAFRTLHKSFHAKS